MKNCRKWDPLDPDDVEFGRYERALIDVENEMQRQDDKWGPQDHPDIVWLAVLTEEVGEVAKEILERRSGGGFDLRKELVQVAAVSVQWLMAMERAERGEQFKVPLS